MKRIPGDEAAEISKAIDRVDRELRLLGLTGVAREQMTAELGRDLKATAAGGGDVEEVLHGDVSQFARELAEAHGVPVEMLEPRTGWDVVRNLGLFVVGSLLILVVLAGAMAALDILPLAIVIGVLELGLAWGVKPPSGARIYRWILTLGAALTIVFSLLIFTATH